MQHTPRKVLILAYDFPPFVSVGGLRPLGWLKYLHEFDYTPTVITRHWSNEFGNERDYISSSSVKETLVEQFEHGTIYRTPYKANFANKLYLKYGEKKYKKFRKYLTGSLEILQFFLPIGPKKNLFLEADKVLSTEHFDLIIATGDPFVLFHYAQKLSKKHGIPWIADYRDPWSHNQEKNGGLHFKILRFLEKRTIRTTSAIVTVSDFIERKLKTIAPTVQFEVIPNGFDPELMADTLAIPVIKNKVLSFAHAGSIYNWNPIEHFLDGVNKFKEKNPTAEFTISFYGANKITRLNTALTLYPALAKHIIIIPRIPNEQLLNELNQQNVLVLFNYFCFMGTKIFDYLGIKKNILFCFENDPVSEDLKQKHLFIDDHDAPRDLQVKLIQKSNAGWIVKDQQDLVSKLELIYAEFEKTGQIACESTNVDQFSRKFQVKELAHLFDKLLENHRN